MIKHQSWHADGFKVVRKVSFQGNETTAVVCNVATASGTAQLIAAAPDLLEALELLLPASYSALSENEMATAREKALAAIEKAKGKNNSKVPLDRDR